MTRFWHHALSAAVAGPDGSIMCQYGCGGAGGIRPNLADPLQKLGIREEGHIWDFRPYILILFDLRSFNALVAWPFEFWVILPVRLIKHNLFGTFKPRGWCPKPMVFPPALRFIFVFPWCHWASKVINHQAVNSGCFPTSCLSTLICLHISLHFASRTVYIVADQFSANKQFLDIDSYSLS